MTEIATVESFTNVLNQLIEAKSLRDGKIFTASRLAKAIKVNRSIVHRILSGEVENPKFETVAKIVKFFVNDGFYLQIEDMLGIKSEIAVREQILIDEKSITFPLYQMQNFNGIKIGKISIELADSSPSTIAIITNEDINLGTIFKSGSIFIVDMLKKLQSGNTVFVKTENKKKLLIKKYIINNKQLPILTSIFGEEEEIIHETKHTIIGVIIHINAKI